ncbi:IWS1 C-terminus domain-containing protein [Theileria equi strain WA]|uniref:IWS1 C-terminus domain-containing protein n=1 Tax=Theileria equi strain WA TaxID=1537102 RepID=L0B1T7_THEEQ|nr:IWS1 C-terminus domain-containing protein [Theileria equi strain WA]AFZ81094.1 IWS1 C-terminus domain-containing protein [Theileria equi strain WA]|eukprot:XP_004830760.1 IWS1 C-terminus domain-containing protein [Theileria equi strain WA]
MDVPEEVESEVTDAAPKHRRLKKNTTESKDANDQVNAEDIKIPKKKTKRKGKRGSGAQDEDFVPAQNAFSDNLNDFTDADFEEVPTTKKSNRGVGKAYFDEVLKRLKERKRQTVKLSDEECQLYCRQLVERMIAAAAEDVESVKLGKPGLSKLKMLSSLSDISKPSWRQWCISEGIAVALASWLAVLPDGSLPNLSVRSKVLQVVLQLPFQSSDLRDNDLGRTVVSLWKHPSECESNKTLIRAIVQKWTRPMLGMSTSYAELQDSSFIDNKSVPTSEDAYKYHKYDFKNAKASKVTVNQERIKNKLSQMYRSMESKQKTPGKATKVSLTGML